MNYLRYIYKTDLLRLVIEEDVVGFYLIVYRNPLFEGSDEDYLVDSLEDAFREAEEKFGISNDQWKLQV